MRFEVSEQIHTRKDPRVIVNALDIQLRKISKVVAREGNVINAHAIEASFGSINRHDTTIFTVQPLEDGVLCVAEVHYRPSAEFWLSFILAPLIWGLLFWIGVSVFFRLGFLFAYGLTCWTPIIFYIVQKKAVRSAIRDVFARVKNEFGILGGAVVHPQPALSPVSSYCNSCGSVLHVGSRFCSSCGATAEPRQGSGATPVTQAAFCFKCGRQIRNTQGICVYCTAKELE